MSEVTFYYCYRVSEGPNDASYYFPHCTMTGYFTLDRALLARLLDTLVLTRRLSCLWLIIYLTRVQDRVIEKHFSVQTHGPKCHIAHY